MGPQMRRRPALKILLGLALLLAGGALAAWLWIEAAAERKWASMERRIAELKAEARARDCRRPPRPGLIPGNDWDDYFEALALLDADPEADALVPEYSPGPAEPEKLEAFAARHPRALELIRRGARRAESRHPDLGEDGYLSGRFWLSTPRMIAAVCAASARRLAREGKPRQAADVLLDLLQAGNDLSRDVIGSSDRHLGEFHTVAAGAFLELRLEEVDARDVAREIERLEADLPTSEAELRTVPLKRALYDLERIHAGRKPAWRFGFSTRLRTAAAFELMEEILGAMAGVDALPYPRAQALAAELEARIAEAGEPPHQVLLTGFIPHLYPHRVNRARLRMLRALLLARATGERLELEDPLGATALRWSPPGQPLRIWSAGYDGRDDGGDEEKDFVLTIDP